MVPPEPYESLRLEHPSPFLILFLSIRRKREVSALKHRTCHLCWPPVVAGAQPQQTASRTATLLLQCPDRRGVVAAVAQLLAGYDCNILESGARTEQCLATVAIPRGYRGTYVSRSGPQISSQTQSRRHTFRYRPRSKNTQHHGLSQLAAA